MREFIGRRFRGVADRVVLLLLLSAAALGLVAATDGGYLHEPQARAGIKLFHGQGSRFLAPLGLLVVLVAMATQVFSRRVKRPAVHVQPRGQKASADSSAQTANEDLAGAMPRRQRHSGGHVCAEAQNLSTPDELLIGVEPARAGRRRHTADLLRRAARQGFLVHTSEGAIVVNGNEQIVSVNPAAAGILESTQERLQHKKLAACGWEFFTEDGAALTAAKNPIARVLRSCAPVKNCCLKIRRPDTKAVVVVEKDLEINTVPLCDSGGRSLGALVMLHDVTNLRRLERIHVAMMEHVRQREKLAALGRLAACVAHEINNPLTGVINYALLLLEKDIGNAEERALLRSIAEEGDRIAGIVNSLLNSARQEKQEPLPASVHSILDAALQLLCRALTNDGITLIRDIPDDLPPLLCRGQQIQQVFINILSNARDALNQKYDGLHPSKILRISAAAAERGGSQMVRTEFYDSGIGIAEDVLAKIFDPFFTTKQASRGTGLGLSVSHDIVKDHGGDIHVESLVGQYTRFIVELPAAYVGEGGSNSA